MNDKTSTTVEPASVDDTCEQLTNKAERFIKECEQDLIDAACLAARKLGPDRKFHNILDPEFTAAGWGLPSFWAESAAERLMPRALCTNDRPEFQQFRELCDDSFRFGRPERQPNTPRNVTIMSPLQLIGRRKTLITDEKFQELVDTLPDYKQFVKAETRLYEMYKRAFVAATEPCAYGCGVRGPHKKCSVCDKLYCSDPCLQNHQERDHKSIAAKPPSVNQ